MNKTGGFTDLFLFIILAMTITFICVVFIYLGGKANTQIHETIDGKMFGDKNGTQIVSQTIGKVNQAYQSLYWIATFLIVGMVISIFIGSYLVTTKPIFFIPYIFIVIIAIVVSVGISNGYEQVMLDPTLAPTFAGMIAPNFIMLQLPIWVTIIGIVGGIIMFVRMGSKENDMYGGTY